jgi:hypothetical protein
MRQIRGSGKRSATGAAAVLGTTLLGAALALAGNGNGGGQNNETGAANGGGKNYCGKTAQNLFKACRDQASANRWQGTAQCVNITEPGARKNCFVVAQILSNDEKKACIGERDARKASCNTLGREAFKGWQDVAMVGDQSAQPPLPGLIDGNRYFPLTAGSREYLAGDTRVIREVSDQLRQVDGRWCRVVLEQRLQNDTLVARSELLYAEDLQDNVWNCGAWHTQYEVLTEGEAPVATGTEGSWEAGQLGAQAGLSMPAVPAFGEGFRRAFAPGVNEDVAEVLDPASVETTFQCSGDCTLLRVSTALRPGSHTLEFYRAGSGLVYSEAPTGQALLELAP